MPMRQRGVMYIDKVDDINAPVLVGNHKVVVLGANGVLHEMPLLSSGNFGHKEGPDFPRTTYSKKWQIKPHYRGLLGFI